MCSACRSCGVPGKLFAKIGYVVFSIFWILISFMLLFTAKDIFGHWIKFIHCPENNTACFGMSAVFRMSFILVLFHLLVFIVAVTRTKIASVFHDGWWTFKFLLVLASFIASFYIDNSFIEGYVMFARITSAFFLIYQGITILGLSYIINNAMVDYWANSDGSCVGIIMIIITALIYGLDIVFLVFQFIWFKGCAINVIILCIVIFFGIAFTVLVVLKTREDSSILTNAFVLSYALYLSWSAMASRPDESCNPFIHSNGNTIYQIALGLLFTLVTLFSVSVMTKSEDSKVPMMSAPLVENEETDEEIGDIPQIGKSENVSAEEAHVFPISLATILFHILMMFACAYYGVLLTNWGDASINSTNTHVFESNTLSFWVKIVAQWG